MSKNLNPESDETVEPEVVAHTGEGTDDEAPCPIIENGGHS
jgi:hypothetical protein